MNAETIIRDHAADELADFIDAFLIERPSARPELEAMLAAADPDHPAAELVPFFERFRLERADVRAALAGALASAAADLSVGLGLPLDGPRPPKGVSA